MFNIFREIGNTKTKYRRGWVIIKRFKENSNEDTSDQEIAEELVEKDIATDIIPKASQSDSEELVKNLEKSLIEDPEIITSMLKVSIFEGTAYFKGKMHSLETEKNIEKVARKFQEIDSVVNDMVLALN